MGGKEDKELTVMQTALDALSGLQAEEQKRVLLWLSEKLKIVPPTHEAKSPLDGRSTAASVGGTTDKTSPSPKVFLAQKKPKSDVERVTCLAFYLHHHRQIGQFKTKDLTKLNSEAAQPKFSNPAVAVQNASVQCQYLTSVGKGCKSITTRGEILVQNLPDREKVKTALEENPPVRRHKKRKKTSAVRK